MRAAIYARVSTDEQVEGYSIDAQLRACRNFAREKDWTVVREYIEEGISARTDNIAKRPKFKDMLDAADNREFDAVIVHKLDRFARNAMVMLKSFQQLSEDDVDFISISEQTDYTTPMGNMFLTVMGAFAQFFSDNLSQDTKKGWAERREQGLYCGPLPFGVMKGEDGVPVPDVQERKVNIGGKVKTICNFEGLKFAFELSAKGESDRKVAVVMNTLGYQTTGTHGPRPFSKDTVKDMTKNKFYIGYIPNGKDGWLKAKHEAFIEPELFEEAQKMRERRTRRPLTIRSDASVYSLSGLARCAECSSTLRAFKGNGRVRLVCNGRLKGWGCTQPSGTLDIYEQQLMAYIGTFHIPPDYQNKILEMYRKMQSAFDMQKEKSALEERLGRVKDLYKWGHITREEYLIESVEIRKDLGQIAAFDPKRNNLETFASFLKDITIAWKHSSQEQRNRLATCLLETVWIEDKKIVAVTPQPEFTPFFDLQYDGVSKYMLHWRPRGDSNPRSPP